MRFFILLEMHPWFTFRHTYKSMANHWSSSWQQLYDYVVLGHPTTMLVGYIRYCIVDMVHNALPCWKNLEILQPKVQLVYKGFNYHYLTLFDHKES